jgi:cell division GTPase FtsZ
VRPDGRALDIAVIGLGQGGGNIASEFFRRGYRALAFNTANTDLAALEPGGVYPAMPADRRIYIGLDGYDGAGADPAYGKECIAENAERIRGAVMKQAGNADVVVVVGGLGGGTGSALAELIGVLKEDNLPLLAMMTLPTEGESGIHKVNAVKAINELVDAKVLGWIFVDNARIAALNTDVSIVDYYAHINGQIASPLDALNCMNSRDDLKAIRSFDGEDFRKLLLSGGVLNYGVANLPNISTEEVVGTIRDCVEASDLMPGGFEMAKLSYLGVVIEASEHALASTPISVLDEINEQLKAETDGGAVYSGVYRSAEEGQTTLRLIAATQTLPHRIRQILADAKREGQVIGEKLREELPTLELGEIEDFELFRQAPRNRVSERPSRRSERPRTSPLTHSSASAIDEIASVDGMKSPTSEASTEDGVNRRDLMAQQERLPDPRIIKRRPVRGGREPGPAPQPSQRPPAPKPGTAAPAKRAPQPAAEDEDDESTGRPEIGTEEIDVVAELASAQDVIAQNVESREVDKTSGELAVSRGRRGGARAAPMAGGETPNPEIYDRLVGDYRQAKHQRARDEVVRRLEEDSISEHTVIRYYAVEAMTKVGRDVFGTALLAATEDENEAVRALAVEALRRH